MKTNLYCPQAKAPCMKDECIHYQPKVTKMVPEPFTWDETKLEKVTLERERCKLWR